MALYNIKNKPIRIISYTIIMPIGMMFYFFVIVVDSAHYGIKCMLSGFIEYFKDNNQCLTVKFFKSAVKLAIDGDKGSNGDAE